MDSTVYDGAVRHLNDFFTSAAAVSPTQVRALRRCGRVARGQVRLQLDPGFLDAVARGAWSPAHDALGRDLRQRAREVARHLVAFRGRRAVATALENAALAVLSDADPAHPLPAPLRARLVLPWITATGLQPSTASPLAA